MTFLIIPPVPSAHPTEEDDDTLSDTSLTNHIRLISTSATLKLPLELVEKFTHATTGSWDWGIR